MTESFIAASGALHNARLLLDGLTIDADRMRANIAMTGGLILAESIMMALAPHVGRGTAHDIVYAACRAAADNKTELVAELRKHTAVTTHLDDASLARLTDPSSYLGSTEAMIDRALAPLERVCSGLNRGIPKGLRI